MIMIMIIIKRRVNNVWYLEKLVELTPLIRKDKNYQHCVNAAYIYSNIIRTTNTHKRIELLS